MKRRTTAVFGIAALMCVLGAACGSSSKSSSSATSAAQTTTAAPTTAGSATTTAAAGSASTGAATTGGGQATGSPIHIGLVCSCSGSFGGPLQAASKTYQAWAKSVNDSGGLNGHPLAIDMQDDKVDPGQSQTIVQKFISDKVDAIVDVSNVDSVWASAVATAKIPVVGGLTTAILYDTNPMFFPAGGTIRSTAMSDLLVAKDAGATSFGYLYCAESPLCSQLVSVFKANGPKVGIKADFSAGISATQPNYTAECVAAQGAGVNAVLPGSSPAVIARIAEDCSRQSYKPIYIVPSLSFASSFATVTGLKDNTWTSYGNLPYWQQDPAVNEMNAAVDKYYPGLRNDKDNFAQVAMSLWASGILMAHAVKASGVTATDDVTSDVVIKGLNSLKADDLGGLSPPLTFTEGKLHSVDCWFVGSLKSAALTLENGGKPQCIQIPS
jgi:branched-chain amino acid transport system substrate-binding protein